MTLIQIIKTDQYWLLVDMSAQTEVPDGGWCFEIHEEYDSPHFRIPDENPKYSWWFRELNMAYLREQPKEFTFWRKIDGSVRAVIGHLPIGDASLLEGVPVLPKIPMEYSFHEACPLQECHREKKCLYDGWMKCPELPKQEEDVEPRFTSQDLDETNYADLQEWINKDALHGLIDEKLGGIIGYIHHKHINRVTDTMNGYKAASQGRMYSAEEKIKLAHDYARNLPSHFNTQECIIAEKAFFDALSTKKYSEEDLRKAISMAQERNSQFDSEKMRTSSTFKYSTDQILQSFSPVQKEWEFEPEFLAVHEKFKQFAPADLDIRNRQNAEQLWDKYVAGQQVLKTIPNPEHPNNLIIQGKWIKK